MQLIKSISLCGQCTRSTCRNCSNYLGTIQQSEDTDNAKAFAKVVSFVCLIVILLMFI